MNISTTNRLVLAATLLLVALDASATSSYLSNANRQYPGIASSKLNDCTLCHTSPPSRNAYGSAFANANHNFAAIENLDSDGDGFTNIQEITALTFPGNASDVPSGATTAVPSLTSVSPSTGPTAGGTPVTLSGTNLTGASVTFGGTPAAGVSVNAGGTQITATTPAHAAGAVSVIAATAGGTSGAVAYTYADTVTPSPPPPSGTAPTLTAILPDSGPAAGGFPVTLTGANLTGASVSFGGTAAVFAIANADGTQVIAISPAHAAGMVSVAATTISGTSSPVAFTYTGAVAPTLAAIRPNAGGTAGGTLVVLTGTNLTGATLSFDGIEATSVLVDAAGTQMATVTPAHAAGAVTVAVILANGTSAQVTYTYGASATPPPPPPPSSSAPTLAAISLGSDSTLGGTFITLTGANLAGASVTFDGTPAANVVVNPNGTQITATTPAHAAGTVNVLVTTSAGASNALVFTYTASGTVTPPATGDDGGDDKASGTATSSAAAAGTAAASTLTAKSLAPQVVEPVLPASTAGAPGATIPPNSVLSVRVTSPTPIDPSSVSAVLTGGGPLGQGGLWRPTTPGDNTDGWIMVAPDRMLPPGAAVTLTASAQTVDGTPIGPITDQFLVASGQSAAQASDTPELVAASNVEPMQDAQGTAVGNPYALTPAEVYNAPVTIQIPVPQGADPGRLGVYYHSPSPAQPGWRPAADVAGWMVPGSQQVVQGKNATYVEIQVNHAGMVQLGTAAAN